MRERGMRVEFQPNVYAKVGQSAHGRGKTHRLANAASPIGGIARFAGTAITCHRAEKWNFVRSRFEIGERSFQRLRRRSHERMMERMIDPNESRKRALRLEFRSYGLERNTRTRECDRTWAIEGGDCYGAVVPSDERHGFILRQTHCQHCSITSCASLHETRSQSANPGRFFDGKDSGDARGSNLAHTVADDRRRLNTPGFPKGSKRHLHGKNGRLPDLRPGHLGHLFGTSELFQKRKPRPRTERRVTTLDRFAKYRLILH